MSETSKTYRAQCQWATRDFLKAYRVSGSVHVDAYNDDDMEANASLRPADAREFARGILALADEIDGGGEAPADAHTVKVGDRLRVTEEDLNFADVVVGEILTVTSLTHDFGDFATSSRFPGESWGFDFEHVGKGLARVDEESAPIPRVAQPLSVARVNLYAEARALAGEHASVSDVLAVAAFLANGSV